MTKAAGRRQDFVRSAADGAWRPGYARRVGDRPRELTIASGEGDANTVFIEVQDTGPGLDPANLDRLFQSFYTTKPDGMGMGLAISRSIVEAHGGWLSAAPNQPHGAVFRLTLPVEEARLPNPF